MKPSRHFIASVSIGTAIWFFTKSFYAGLVCFVFGFLIDFDHILEYMLHYGLKDLSIKRIYHICEQTHKQQGKDRFRKSHLVFHIAEVAILLWIGAMYTKNIYLFAAALGYSVHLIMDYIGNHAYPHTYFIIWRALNNFNTEAFFKITAKQ